MSLPDFLFFGESEDAPGESSLEKRHGDGRRMTGIADEGASGAVEKLQRANAKRRDGFAVGGGNALGLWWALGAAGKLRKANAKRRDGGAVGGGNALWWALGAVGNCEGRMRNDAMGARMRAA